jgi:hypothetical protein
MYKKWYKISLLIGIVILFFGASIIPGNNVNTDIICINPIELILDINDGLMGYWSFDVISDTIVPDESENNNEGFSWSPKETEGFSGLALDFDGINDCVYVSDNPSLNFHDTNEFSLSIWINREGSMISLSEGLISKATSTPGPNGYIMVIRQITNLIRFTIYDGIKGYPINSTIEIDEDKWYHVVGTWDGTTSKLYINGVLDNTETFSGVTVSNDYKLLELGNHYGTHSYHGIIDEVRIYDRTLSNDEVKELYNNPAGLKTTILFGQIKNLSSNVGKLEIFEAQKLRYIQFSPFEFKILSSGERIKVSDSYKGILTSGFAFGIFQSNV